MISITVVSYNGASVPPLAAMFDSAGGSIGRADVNGLVLPDPDRNISRVHAEIVTRDANAFAIVNRGGNSIALNGRVLESGGESAIGAGDELQIGGYVLRVALGPSPAPAAATHSPVVAAGAIPPDWDPFAMDDIAPTPTPTPTDAPRVDTVRPAPSLAIPSSADTSLDAFFGLPAGGGTDSLVNWGQGSQAFQNLVPDELRHTASPPLAAPVQAQASARDLAGESSTDRVAPAGSILSWNIPSGESAAIVYLPGGAKAEANPGPSPTATSSPASAAVVRPATPSLPPVQQSAAVHAKPSRQSAEVSHPPAETGSVPLAALAQAWKEGLNAEGLPPEALRLTPALMLLLGRLLREVTRGTLDLLAARMALKREIRAEVTMIVARDNNPLKFSSTVDVALGHLLGAAERGFKPADVAMREAYEDLRAHQFATLAGMRAALEGIFVRFDPAELEGKLTQKSVVDALLPSARKARMWDLFNQMYTQLAAEAQDDFHELFGKAFLRAYEEHLGQREDDLS